MEWTIYRAKQLPGPGDLNVGGDLNDTTFNAYSQQQQERAQKLSQKNVKKLRGAVKSVMAFKAVNAFAADNAQKTKVGTVCVI